MMATKRKVRADFDKNQSMSITVNVSGHSKGVKEQVQQAFFDVGITWGLVNGDEYRNLDMDFYTNTYLGGRVSHDLMWSNTDGVSGLANIVTPSEFFAMVYEDEPQGHPHADLMMQYAEDAKTNSEPWNLWQIMREKDEAFIDCSHNPSWHANSSYRRKQKTHMVHGVEVPDLRVTPNNDDSYYYPSPACPNLVDVDIFDSTIISDIYKLENNLCYEHTEAGKQAAILHAKIMLGIA